MNRKYVRVLCAVLAVCLLMPLTVVAGTDTNEAQVFIRGIRPLGMGGAFVAVADDQNAVFYNPAGLTQRRGAQLTIFELPINISEDVLNFYNYYQDNEDKLKDFDTLSNDDKTSVINDISNKITKYHTRLRLGFPNTSFLSGPGFLSWGFGAFTHADIGFQIKSGIIVPNVSFWGNVDALGVVPLAHRFEALPYVPGKLSVGANIKYINRARIAEYNKSILEFENFDPLLQWGNGYGFDVGTIYQPNHAWNIGMQIMDIGGTTLRFQRIESTKSAEIKEAANGLIRPMCNIGTAFIPSKIHYWPGKSFGTKDRLLFALDVRDVFNSDEPLFEDTLWKKVHMGAEFRWFALALRGGYNQGYPSFGAGLNLFLVQLEYAYWGDEAGRYAGQAAEWNHQVTIAMRFGQNKGRAWGRAATAQQTVEPVKQAEPAPVIMEQPTPAVALEQDTTSQVTTPAEEPSQPTTDTTPAQPEQPAESENAPEAPSAQ